MKFVPLPDDDLPADFRARLGFADGVGPHGSAGIHATTLPAPDAGDRQCPIPCQGRSRPRATG